MDLALEQVVNFATRANNTLDLIFMSHPGYKVRCKSLPPIGHKTDHDIVLLDTSLKPYRARPPRRKIYLWKKANIQEIKKHLQSFASTFNYDNLTSIEVAWTQFKAAISSAVDKFVPTKMSSTRQTHPWVDTKLRRLIRRKQRAHWRAKKTKKDRHWKQYKDLQKIVQQSTRQAERDFMQKVVSKDLTLNPKRFWSYIKSRKQEAEGISPLVDNDGYLQSDSQRKAEIINSQFQSVYTKEDTSSLPDMGPSPHPAIEDITVTIPGIIKLLRNLNPHKAAGPDSIPTYILKVAADEIAPVLCTIFQYSLDTGTVPTDWNQANIVPIYKKGDKHRASNYRPVSLTSITCKILEHIVHSQVINHFEAHNILCDNQHGFRKGRSCVTQLITTIHGIASQLCSGRDQVDVILLDFSKAFDKVPHERLLHKLNHYGVRRNTLQWIRAFLTSRKQQVLLDGVSSLQADVVSGVPQGTVLGPLLFLAFINDMPEGVTSETRLFADDGLLYRKIRSDEDARILQRDLNALQQWEEKWQMSFHPEKCQVIHMCTNERFRKQFSYELHGHTLEAVDSAKYLGVNLHQNLNWKQHVDSTATKASKTLGFLRRNLYNCTQSTRERTYSTLVLPVLNYAAAAWDPYCTSDINRLEQVQRRGARYVTNNHWNRTPGCVSAMIKNLGWQSLQQQRQDIRLILLYKIQHQLVDVNPGHIQHSDSRTRGRARIHQAVAGSRVFSNSFYPRTVREWNHLPPSVTDATTLDAFKTAMSLHRAASSSPTF